MKKPLFFMTYHKDVFSPFLYSTGYTETSPDTVYQKTTESVRTRRQITGKQLGNLP